MSDPTFREVEKGPTFEVYRGQLCALRLDWRNDAMRCIYVGSLCGECADAIIRRWEVALRLKQQLTVFHDIWEATNYESELRVKLTQWGQKNPTVFAAAHFLSRSKITNMAISVISLAVPGMNIKSYGKRADFDVLVKKCGLPLNVPVPTPAGLGSAHPGSS